MIILRNLPLVIELEELFRNPRNLQYPESSYTWEKVDKACEKLFGVTSRQVTFYDPKTGNVNTEIPYEDTAYFEDDRFDVAEMCWEDAKSFFLAVGWDLSDEDGDEYHLAESFKAPIVCALHEVIPGCKFDPDGRMKPLFDYKGQRLSSPEAWKEGLESEVKDFLRKRRP